MLMEHTKTQLTETPHSETSNLALNLHSPAGVRLRGSHRTPYQGFRSGSNMHMQTGQLPSPLPDSWEPDMKCALTTAKAKSVVATVFIYLFLILAALVASVNLVFFLPKSLFLIPIFLAAALAVAWWDRH